MRSSPQILEQSSQLPEKTRQSQFFSPKIRNDPNKTKAYFISEPQILEQHSPANSPVVEIVKTLTTQEPKA